MPNPSPIKPRLEHWVLYKEVMHHEPAPPRRHTLNRLVLLVLAALVLALVGPYLPSGRHFGATTPEEYRWALPGSIVVASFLLVVGMYHFLIKPARNRQAGYRLVGQFPVWGKAELFGKRWLELPPDDTHRVGVPNDFYHTISKGDVVEVVYSAYHDFISVRKISVPSATS